MNIDLMGISVVLLAGEDKLCSQSYVELNILLAEIAKKSGISQSDMSESLKILSEFDQHSPDCATNNVAGGLLPTPCDCDGDEKKSIESAVTALLESGDYDENPLSLRNWDLNEWKKFIRELAGACGREISAKAMPLVESHVLRLMQGRKSHEH